MRWIALFLLMLMLPFDSPAQEQETGELVVAYGLFDLRKHTIPDIRMEYRFGRKMGAVRPIAGAMLTTQRSNYVYLGVNYDLALTQILTISLNVAAGAYHRGAGKELGGLLEFRSGIDVWIQWNPRIWMGWSFHHLSNASIYSYNPGVETLMYSLSIRDLF